VLAVIAAPWWISWQAAGMVAELNGVVEEYEESSGSD